MFLRYTIPTNWQMGEKIDIFDGGREERLFDKKSSQDASSSHITKYQKIVIYKWYRKKGNAPDFWSSILNANLWTQTQACHASLDLLPKNAVNRSTWFCKGCSYCWCCCWVRARRGGRGVGGYIIGGYPCYLGRNRPGPSGSGREIHLPHLELVSIIITESGIWVWLWVGVIKPTVNPARWES